MTSDSKLAEWRELADLNYAESMRELSRRAGGAVHDEGGVLLYAGNHPLPVFINGFMRTAGKGDPTDELERARHFFAPRRRGYSVVVRAHLDQDLASAATTSGLIQLGDSPGMVLDHRLADVSLPDGVVLRHVESDTDRLDFIDINGRAYQSLGAPADMAAAAFPALQALCAPHIAAFVAYVNDAPAAAAMVIVTHGVAGVYWVGTVAEARGRGLAEVCTRAAGNAGFDLGARVAALQASPMGEPVYRRMGYVEVTRYPCLVQIDPPGES